MGWIIRNVRDSPSKYWELWVEGKGIERGRKNRKITCIFRMAFELPRSFIKKAQSAFTQARLRNSHDICTRK